MKAGGLTKPDTNSNRRVSILYKKNVLFWNTFMWHHAFIVCTWWLNWFSHGLQVLKPIIEKRRRERINNHLEELKNLVCGNTRSKLEKADILELTVNHLRKLITSQRRTHNVPQKVMDTSRPYLPCSQEVQRFMVGSENIYQTQAQAIYAANQRLSSVGSPIELSPQSSPARPQSFVFLPVDNSKVYTNTIKQELWRPW